MKQQIRCLFGTILEVDTEYSMVKLKIGNRTCILTPEAVALLSGILGREEEYEQPYEEEDELVMLD